MRSIQSLSRTIECEVANGGPRTSNLNRVWLVDEPGENVGGRLFHDHELTFYMSDSPLTRERVTFWYRRISPFMQATKSCLSSSPHARATAGSLSWYCCRGELVCRSYIARIRSWVAQARCRPLGEVSRARTDSRRGQVQDLRYSGSVIEVNERRGPLISFRRFIRSWGLGRVGAWCLQIDLID